MVGNSRSFKDIYYKDVRQPYMQMEMSVALASMKLYFW